MHGVGKYDPSTELPRDFCAGIGPLQLGVVLVFLLFFFKPNTSTSLISKGKLLLYYGLSKMLTNTIRKSLIRSQHGNYQFDHQASDSVPHVQSLPE